MAGQTLLERLLDMQQSFILCIEGLLVLDLFLLPIQFDILRLELLISSLRLVAFITQLLYRLILLHNL